MHYDDVLPTPSSMAFGFNGVDTLRHSGNFPVGRTRLNMTLIPMIQHIYHLEFIMTLYFMGYIKDVD